MPLIRNAEQVEDRYRRIADDASVPEEGAVLLPAAQFLAGAERIAGRPGATGEIWPNDRDVAELAPYLGRLALVALVFPTFRDGRAYSQARALRERYRFGGELRATGDVLRDQFLFLRRAGFNAFEVRKPEDAQAFCDALQRYDVFYQPAADGERGALRHRRNAGPRLRHAVTELA
ncbi:MAG: DUF934 domain-containing protein [Pseudorhodoplanes sp.]